MHLAYNNIGILKYENMFVSGEYSLMISKEFPNADIYAFKRHHQYMFDGENIIVVLEKVGFRNVRLRVFDQTLDLEVRDYDSIYVQAEK